jgi:hypothetical protein
MSVIARNIATLGQKFTDGLQYRDIDYRGFRGATIDPTLTGGQVIINDLKLWLQSSRGDYYRRFSMGGFFDNMREYPLSDDGAKAVEMALRSAITKQFPNVTILDLQVTVDQLARGWIIQLVAQDKLTGALAPLTTGIDYTA